MRLAAILLGVLALAPACTVTQGVSPGRESLRVGMAADSPPIAFLEGGRLAGIEVDLARGLATELGRPLEIVPHPWGDLIPALLDGRIDIVMSGMTITRAREVRIAFGDPYLRSGLMAAMRLGDLGRYPSPEAVREATVTVGARQGTTAERFVRDRMRYATVNLYPDVEAAILELRQRRVDLVVSDTPIIIWAVSANEGEVGFLRARLAEDELAWGFRPGDADLRAAANAVLARWKTDGTLHRILIRWLPYLDQLDRP